MYYNHTAFVFVFFSIVFVGGVLRFNTMAVGSGAILHSGMFSFTRLLND